MTLKRASELIKIIEFCRGEALAQRRDNGLGMPHLMREGFPDLRWKSASEIDKFADYVEKNGVFPKRWSDI